MAKGHAKRLRDTARAIVKRTAWIIDCFNVHSSKADLDAEALVRLAANIMERQADVVEGCADA